MKQEWDGGLLFQFGEFILASGAISRFKLVCEAVAPEEWHSLARIALPILPAFDRVVSVPRGGDAWATIFSQYIQPQSGAHRVLVVDDVWTTGKSMFARVERIEIDSPHDFKFGFKWHGVVLFARGPVPKNVTALFTLNENLQ